MRQVPRIPSPTIPQGERKRPLDSETRTVLDDIRAVLADSEERLPPETDMGGGDSPADD